MKRFIEGENRTQSVVFPERLDDYIRVFTRSLPEAAARSDSTTACGDERLTH